MSSQIEDKVSKCYICDQFQRAQPREPVIIQEPPDRPWSKISSDLFELNGVHYLLSVHYYFKWIEIAKLDGLTNSNFSCHLKSQFARYGIPHEQQWVSATMVPSIQAQQSKISEGVMDFCRPLEVLTILSQMVKSKEPCKPLRTSSRKEKIPIRLYWTKITPLDRIGLSPDQILMGRRLKTYLPTNAELLKPQGTQEIKQHLQNIKERQKFYYDKHCSKESPPLDL